MDPEILGTIFYKFLTVFFKKKFQFFQLFFVAFSFFSSFLRCFFSFLQSQTWGFPLARQGCIGAEVSVEWYPEGSTLRLPASVASTPLPASFTCRRA